MANPKLLSRRKQNFHNNPNRNNEFENNSNSDPKQKRHSLRPAESYYFVLYFWQLQPGAKRIFMVILVGHKTNWNCNCKKDEQLGDMAFWMRQQLAASAVQQLFNSPQLKYENKSDKLPTVAIDRK